MIIFDYYIGGAASLPILLAAWVGCLFSLCLFRMFLNQPQLIVLLAHMEVGVVCCLLVYYVYAYEVIKTGANVVTFLLSCFIPLHQLQEFYKLECWSLASLSSLG